MGINLNKRENKKQGTINFFFLMGEIEMKFGKYLESLWLLLTEH